MFSKTDFAAGEIPSDKAGNLNSFIKKFPEKVEELCNYFNDRGVYAAYVISPVAQLNKPLTEIERHLLFRHESFSPGLNLFTQRSEEGIVKALTKNENIRIIDQSRVFEGIKDTVYYDGVHYTPEGSRLHAEKLSEELTVIIKEIQNKNAEKN